MSFDDHIIDNFFPLKPVDGLSDIRLHTRTERQLSADERQLVFYLDGLDRFCFIPFIGGKLMSAWLLEHPEEVRGKNVADIGSGSGLVAIAAAKCGAHVTAIDNDEITCGIIARNAAANGVADKITIVHTGAERFSYAAFDVITAAEIFYNTRAKRALSELLVEQFRQGKTVLAAAYQKSELADLTGDDLLARHERKARTKLYDGVIRLGPR